ncbi:alpha/beta hydrolase [Nocardia abscessus]|uniref:alpha/beta fold hydrolase n=1 Tax=Nocardia abscessus TaxID=120957 RepID=UPI001893BF63|nr:alpha/beta hydrolase [Nocardia abscessus]MBF6341696.1 alpha/beta hydrolase [Nocardia abscessus]
MWKEQILGGQVDLFVASAGHSASPVLLVVHGGPDWDHSYLREPLAQLARTHHLLLPDLRGCGRSARGLPVTAYHPDAVVADLLAVLDAYRADAADVLGFSYGALLAQRLAVAAPHRVRRLILASSSVIPVPADAFTHWPLRAQRRARELAVWSDPTLSGPQRVREAAFAAASMNIWRPGALPEYLNRLAAIRFSAEWDRARNTGCLPSARIEDPVRRLSETGIPILLLHGRQDMIFPAALAEQAAALIANADAAILDEAGHMTHIDDPRRWLSMIEQYLG